MKRYSFALVFTRNTYGVVNIQLRSGNYKADSVNEARG